MFNYTFIFQFRMLPFDSYIPSLLDNNIRVLVYAGNFIDMLVLFELVEIFYLIYYKIIFR